ncbi:hypothetical protein PSN45_002377 [Yamadazyma tenuis]|nr:hypothetical protein PSN45_002377 [Yamadazyma tenuis]
MCRLTLSDDDKEVRDWFIKEVNSLGCKVKIDQLGNIFAIYSGQKDGLPTAIGSHLDTQPTGGRYDGILGVLCGLEVLRTIKDNGFTPKYPIAVINWTNEEGARFPVSLMSSLVWSGAHDLQETYNLKSITDDVPVTVRDELERIGYIGDVPVDYKQNPIKCHFEIHIEQGPILEESNKKIGIVVGAQGYDWTKVHVKGKATHTGTTPFYARSDALLATSQMICKGNELAKKAEGLFSVGVLNLLPKVVNVIPDSTEFVMDLRHPIKDSLHKLKDDCVEEFKKIAHEAGRNVSVEFEHVMLSDPLEFHADCVSCVQSAAVELYGKDNVLEIVSGAGHDSCATSGVVPTSMIFIPSKDGVSHNPEEYSTPEQVAEGFQVLLNAVLRYDSLRVD